MRFKNGLLVLLLLLVVGVSCVSAADNSSMEGISTNEVTDNVISVDETADDISMSDTEEIVSDDESSQSTYTWTDFKSDVENTGNSIVKLNQSNVAPSSDSNDQIKLNHDITIVGGYGYYIGSDSWNNANSYDYIPIITSGSNLNVNFENLTFQYLSDNILIKLMGNGNFAFKNCVFNNINCTGSHQSVIWLNYGYALIENCTFTNVKSSFGAVTNYYSSWGNTVNNARMTVRDSTFKNNYATTEPGAINNCGKLEVYDSTFENNEAFWWAGAIHTHMYANTTIVGSKFKNNIAGWNGGALYTYSTLTVINSTFTGNEAHQTSGGAIAASAYGSRPTVVIENCDFNDNLAYGAGGAISFSGTSLTVENSRFKYNAALSGNGGGISYSGTGSLTVDQSVFVNNTAKDDNSGHALSYSYTGSSSTAAYLTYTNNQFYGPNNGAGSVYVANSYVNIVKNNNTIDDISNYTEPEEEDTLPTGNVPIPSGKEITASSWNTVLNGALSGAPVISGNYILVPANHNLYCFDYASHALVWNFTSEHGYFHELLVENNIVYAPASYDALYLLYLNNGSSLTDNNIYQGSSLYAPLLYNNTIYLSSEYAYGNNWINLVKYNGTNYYYNSSILTINGITYGTPAMLSKPYLYGNNIYVNTVNGLMSYNLNTGLTNSVSDTVGNPIIDADGYICILTNNGTSLSLLDSNLNSISSVDLDGTCNMLVAGDNGKVYTVDENGYIYYASYTSSSLSCSKTKVNINPITSAMTYYNNRIYIGDNNGILWVFNVNNLNKPTLKNSVLAAFNAGSTITGGITVNSDGTVYFGTVNGDLYSVTITN